MATITAVIPAYNEAIRIAQTLNQIKSFVDEIIVVDDASTDGTAGIASTHGAVVFSQAKNSGYINAIKRGFSHANGDIVVTIDADGEFPADQIPALVKPILDGEADMVQGHRNIIPRPSEKVLTWLAQRKANVGDSGTGLRAVRTELAKTLEIDGACICGIFSLEVLSKGGRIVDVPITLEQTEKPRKIAWFHLKQFFDVFLWLFKKV